MFVSCWRDSRRRLPDAPVLGIYIGWRGAVVGAPILKEFTFWDRHQKSQNLPGAHLVEALLKIMQQQQGARDDDPAAPLTALIGHSFGGAVLEESAGPCSRDSITMVSKRPVELT